MKTSPLLLAIALANSIAAHAEHSDTQNPAPAATETAPQFIARVNAESYPRVKESNAASWVAATYINDDTQLLSAKASERSLAEQSRILAQTESYRGEKSDPATERALYVLRVNNTVLPPKDPALQGELAALAAGLEAAYGAGKSCTDPTDPATCRDLTALSKVLAESRKPEELAEAWSAWHNLAKGSKADYVRFADLLNQGAQDYGFKDAGQLWRSGYDMPPDEFSGEVERLYSQVEPLYKELHCYVRGRLNAKYGDQIAPKRGPIRADLLGNMWSQEWGNIWDLVEPYPDTPSLDVNSKLTEQKWDAPRMARQAEDFYVSLGMPKLPESFWTHAQLVKPRDRDVVCHASAWDVDNDNDGEDDACCAYS